MSSARLRLGDAYDKSDQRRGGGGALQQQVRDQGLWAAHLSRTWADGLRAGEAGLLKELWGRSPWAPSVFGAGADSGNAEILAHFGTAEQKAKYLQPLLDGAISSCYSMTEPHAGADPTLFQTRAMRDGDEWVITGEKWFSSHARYASFMVVMAVTNPDVSAYEGMSMFIVPADAPGLSIIRNVGVGSEPASEGSHGYLPLRQRAVPATISLPAEAAPSPCPDPLGGGRITRHADRSPSAQRPST